MIQHPLKPLAAIIVLFGLLTTSLFANKPLNIPIGSLRLPDGSAVSQAFVVGKNPTGVNVRHATGVTFVHYRSLPASLRTKLGYDPNAEKAWYAAIARQKRAEAMAKKREKDEKTKKEQLAKREKEIEKFQERLQKLDEESVGGGTGFFVTPDGYLVTNEHVIRTARLRKGSKIKLVWTDKILDAKVLAFDKEKDIAVLKATLPEGTTEFPCLPLSRDPVAEMGSSVFTIGFPQPWLYGWTPKLAEGSISSVRGLQGDKLDYQLMMPVHGGNSGGALIDGQTGEVVGVVSSKINESVAARYTGETAATISYARKIHLAADVFKKVKEFPYAKLRKAIKEGQEPDRKRLISYVRESTVAINILVPPRRIGVPFDE